MAARRARGQERRAGVRAPRREPDPARARARIVGGGLRRGRRARRPSARSRAASPRRCCELAAEIEGHPDNAAAAIAGGFTLAFGDGVDPARAAPGPAPVALRPERRPAADRRGARGAPSGGAARRRGVQRRPRRRDGRGAHVRTGAAHADAGGPAARAGASRTWSPACARCFDQLRAAGVPVCVSGAGPTLLAFQLERRVDARSGRGLAGHAASAVARLRGRDRRWLRPGCPSAWASRLEPSWSRSPTSPTHTSVRRTSCPT